MVADPQADPRFAGSMQYRSIAGHPGRPPSGEHASRHTRNQKVKVLFSAFALERTRVRGSAETTMSSTYSYRGDTGQNYVPRQPRLLGAPSYLILHSKSILAHALTLKRFVLNPSDVRKPPSFAGLRVEGFTQRGHHNLRLMIILATVNKSTS